MDIAAFVEAQLSPTPARVLEIGCGAGDLAWAVTRVGYRVVAIDPKAPDGDIFESVSLEEFAGRDRDRPLGAHPDEAEPRQRAGPAWRRPATRSLAQEVAERRRPAA